MKLISVLIGVSLFSQISLGFAQPDLVKTPGVLCTATDPNFSNYDYPENIARCARNISQQEKQQVAQDYGNIPHDQWNQYEFDHLIPLCAGGSDDPKNLWPQPIADAHKKDVLEVEICTAMKAGTMLQAEALQKVHDWFTQLQEAQK